MSSKSLSSRKPRQHPYRPRHNSNSSRDHPHQQYDISQPAHPSLMRVQSHHDDPHLTLQPLGLHTRSVSHNGQTGTLSSSHFANHSNAPSHFLPSPSPSASRTHHAHSHSVNFAASSLPTSPRRSRDRATSKSKSNSR